MELFSIRIQRTFQLVSTVIKKIIYKISIYKVLPPYKNWYSIMTNDGLNRSNVVIIGKKQLLYL